MVDQSRLTRAVGGDSQVARTAILLIPLATAMFAGLDALAKVLTKDLSIIQAVWGRYVFSLLFVMILFARVPARRLLTTANLPLQLGRSMLLVAATAAFWIGLLYLPLADASAIGFVSPLRSTTTGASSISRLPSVIPST